MDGHHLHPAGTTMSYGFGAGSGQQVGYAQVGPTVGHSRASLWTGSAASWVDLHPAGALNSQAYAVSGGQQVGRIVKDGVIRASLWSGTVASREDLHAFLPAEFTSSEAHGIWIDGGVPHVVGYGFNNATNQSEALLWVGTAPVCCAGDFDNSNAVTVADTSDFVDALLVGDACPAPPACCPADLDANGIVDGADMPGFVAKLLAGGACP